MGLPLRSNLTLGTGECMGCRKDVFKPPSEFKYWGGYCKPCVSDRLRTGVVIARGYCIDCNVDIFKKPSEFKNWSGLCTPCSRKNRRGIAHSIETRQKISQKRKGKLAGENHWNWQGGITEPNDKERVVFKRTTQKAVLKRDNYTCQVCDQYGGHLQVDHIKSWAKYPELRLEPSNCRTLCMACHYYVTFKRKLPQGVIWGHNFSKRVTS